MAMNPIYLNRINNAKASKQKSLVLAERDGTVLNAPQSWKDSLDDPSFTQANRARVLAAVQAEMEQEENAEADLAYAQSITAQSDPVSRHYAALIGAYKSSPAMFRKSERSSAKRTLLRTATRLTHEQIEGWYIMFEREPAARRNALIEYFSNAKNLYAASDKEGGAEYLAEASGSDPDMKEAPSKATPEAAASKARPSPSARTSAKAKTHHRKDKAARKMMRSTGLA